ncbi:MAG: Ig-like domain-containing protein [Treponema sp.]|nr:Ig-like domain-containing protein [Treponema sp.]
MRRRDLRGTVLPPALAFVFAAIIAFSLAACDTPENPPPSAPNPTGITIMLPLNVSEDYLVEQGRQYQFSAAITPEGASQNVDWSIYPENAGTMVNGLLTPTADFDTEITVTATARNHPTITDSVKVTVTEALDINIDPGVTNLMPGQQLQLSATVDPAGAHDIEWSVARFVNWFDPEYWWGDGPVAAIDADGLLSVHYWAPTNNFHFFVRAQVAGRPDVYAEVQIFVVAAPPVTITITGLEPHYTELTDSGFPEPVWSSRLRVLNADTWETVGFNWELGRTESSITFEVQNVNLPLDNVILVLDFRYEERDEILVEVDRIVYATAPMDITELASYIAFTAFSDQQSNFSITLEDIPVEYSGSWAHIELVSSNTDTDHHAWASISGQSAVFEFYFVKPGEFSNITLVVGGGGWLFYDSVLLPLHLNSYDTLSFDDFSDPWG